MREKLPLNCQTLPKKRRNDGRKVSGYFIFAPTFFWPGKISILKFLRFFNVRAENFPARKHSGQKIRVAGISDRPYPVRSIVRELVTVYAILKEGVETIHSAGPLMTPGIPGLI